MKEKKVRRRFGDRYDGRLIRGLDPFYKIIPFLMKERSDAQNFFYDEIEITKADLFVKRLRKEGHKNLKLLHVLIAAYIRTLAYYPALNRFIAGRKIYARNEILISMAIKKELKVDAPETTIKVSFEKSSTIFDVINLFNAEIEKNKDINTSNSTDNLARIIMKCPNFIIRFLVFILWKADNFGLLPKAINKASPFHTSIFFTDLGSIGIEPVYHHLYNFGTTSVFIAIGPKRKAEKITKDGIIAIRKYVTSRIVTDERICDGHYYASAFKYFKKLMKNPEELLLEPETVKEDIY